MRRFSSFLYGSTAAPRYLRHLSRKEITSPPYSRRSLLSKSVIFSVEKSYQQSNLLRFSFGGINNISLYNQLHYVQFSNLSSNEEIENHNLQQLQVEIISKEFIKPAIPTPERLRTHELALIDQLFPNVYVPFVFFYTNDDNHQQKDDQLTLKRRQILKESLSKTLTKFYPLAGRLKDNRCHIDCNDDGVYYVEAKVSNHLSDFLKQADINKFVHGLLPFRPTSVQSLSEKHLLMVQVTEFGCGGLAIGTYTSHKLMDAHAIATFLKAWSTAARAPSEEITPSFVFSSMLPPNPDLPQDATCLVFPQFGKTKTSTRRFVFPASSLATLKNKLNSSRVLAVTAFIWKRTLQASKAQTKAIDNLSTLSIAVNIRDRVSPPLPPYSMGNIHLVTAPVQCSGDEDFGVDTIVQRIKDAASRLNREFLEQMSAYMLSNTETTLSMLHAPYSDKNAKHMLISSACNSGTYEVDFGWGKPIWVTIANGDSNFLFTENFVALLDTRCGKGIEAWVTLSEADMKVFEKDPELLAFASLNSSPLDQSVE